MNHFTRRIALAALFAWPAATILGCRPADLGLQTGDAPDLVVSASELRLGDGVRIASRGARLPLDDRGELRIGLVAVRRGLEVRTATESTPHRSAADVRVERGVGITEWWRDVPGGLEHGVDLALAFQRDLPGPGPLALDVAVTGGRARLGATGEIEIVSDGERIATYGALSVIDADGATVPSRLVAMGEVIRIEVDDAEARYPLVVDPLVVTELATLTAPGATVDDVLGNAVAISSDTTRALIGASGTDSAGGSNSGSARVFVRSGATWSLEAALLPTDAGREELVGLRVALTGDATRAVLGSRHGGAWVFRRSGSSWTEEARLLAPGAIAADGMGSAVAISGSGDRILLGALFDDTDLGARAGTGWVYQRTGATWALEATLEAAGASDDTLFGFNVALSADGALAVLSAHGDTVGTHAVAGSVRTFVRSGSAWTEGTALDAGTAASLGEAFGFAIALTSDATRLLVGATGFGGTTARAWVYRRSAGAWTLEGAVPIPGFDLAGGPVLSFADTGARIAIGLPGSGPPSNAGSVWIGVRDGTTWSHEATVVGSDRLSGDNLGTSVALSTDGSVLLAGAAGDDVGTPSVVNGGSARLFALARAPNGIACTSAAVCVSGFCVDGVCCDGACGGGSTGDCLACAVARGAATDGVCGPASSTTVCRATAGVCDQAERCDGTSSVCPTNLFAPSSASCRPSAGLCDLPESCTGSAAACPSDLVAPSSTTCRAGAGVCDAAERCTGSDVACPLDQFVSSSTVCRAAAGDCDLTESCTGSGPNCPLDVLSSSVCRLAGGPCDLAERCSGGVSCPPDAFASGNECRSSAGDCDIAELCTGAGAGCPPDDFEPLGVECRAALGPCDVAELCFGTGPSCPTNQVRSSGSVCNASLGACDPAELCDGAAVVCPADVRAPLGTRCGGTTEGSCSTPGTCNGTAPACEGGTPLAAGTECLAIDPTDPCDVADICDGTSDACRPRYASADTTCGGVGDLGPCDAPDHCAGTSSDCVSNYLVGVECRAAQGACDTPELCLGDTLECGSDVVESAGMVCRSALASCDVEESCDGTSFACPADETACEEDGGVSITRDAGASADAGEPLAATGCACAASRARSSASGLWLLLAVALLARRRREGRIGSPSVR